jgi:1-acyl-sn-glycerol-3-phosphate acyltransferase
MDANDIDNSAIPKWDPSFTEHVKNATRPLIRGWFRSEVRGLDSFPPDGGALVVSNHSGGMWSVDVLVFASHFYDKFGYDRPVHTLAHYGLFVRPLAEWLVRGGVIRASRENAAKALHSGSVVLVFPGGNYDVFRPTLSQNVIDFNGRTGYVRTAIQAGVPIVPTVSIGAQESQLFLTRGTWLAKRLGLTRARLETLPLSFGFPFGPSVLFLPPNLPLPTKIVAQVLEPVDLVARFGRDPDVKEVDVHVRSVMQNALNRLARERRFPVLG